MLVILVFQLCFMLANCRHEILSYDKPQDATRDERADTEISDNTHDILVIGKNLTQSILTSTIFQIFQNSFHLEYASPSLVNQYTGSLSCFAAICGVYRRVLEVKHTMQSLILDFKCAIINSGKFVCLDECYIFFSNS